MVNSVESVGGGSVTVNVHGNVMETWISPNRTQTCSFDRQIGDATILVMEKSCGRNCREIDKKTGRVIVISAHDHRST